MILKLMMESLDLVVYANQDLYI